MEGNQMKMREALLKLRAEIGRFYYNEWIPYDAWQGCDDVISHALSAPPRNCDVGTAEEQEERLVEFCNSTDCGRCPHNRVGMDFRGCTLTWAQSHYESDKKGDGDGM